MAGKDGIKVFTGTGDIFYEDDYTKFKRLKGNRGVEWPRVSGIVRSIEKVGYVPAPIVVNEKMEVIDGQARIEACSYFELPIAYTVVPGAGRDECIAMNISGQKWKLQDYIDSYAETGHPSYVLLNNLRKMHSTLAIGTFLTAVCGTLDHNENAIRSGEFKLNESRFREADETLSYLERFEPIAKEKKIPGMRRLYEALCFMHLIEKIDDERMYHAFTMYHEDIGGHSNTEQALNALEAIYNRKLPKDSKVYVANEYREYQAKKYPWYESRYGKHE